MHLAVPLFDIGSLQTSDVADLYSDSGGTLLAYNKWNS